LRSDGIVDGLRATNFGSGLQAKSALIPPVVFAFRRTMAGPTPLLATSRLVEALAKAAGACYSESLDRLYGLRAPR